MASRHTNRTTAGKQQLDVLVVGAGPTGLTLAAQLQAFGATCRIVDLATLDPFVHMDQMGEVDYAPREPKGTPWHPTAASRPSPT
jgi:threonine dehydrogenase-like Zn-dependent dehydrogenase